tara:strand:+ start:6207 stop:7142 length:936 start_codon:yes stop_codon:yes gene_type:complete
MKVQNKKLKVLDLFSGIGGFSLGLERAGMRTIAFCEIDKHCHKVLNKHWPHTKIFTDVKKLKFNESSALFEKGSFDDGIMTMGIDVVCGGFPCQDISTAGKKKGFKHDGKRTRSGLWEEFKRIIKEVKPRYAIIENVANLRSIGLNQVVKDLWSIGYMCEWHIISARSVGACHLRERIWIIAYPVNEGLQRHGRKEECGKLSEENREKQEYRGPKPGSSSTSEQLQTTDSNMPRFWKAHASEEASLRWWSETTAGLSDRREVESMLCGVDDGLSGELDKARAERVKQVGNTVHPLIPELIGKMILEYEGGL